MPVASYRTFDGRRRLDHQARGQCTECKRAIERVLVGDPADHRGREWLAVETKWPYGLIRHKCR